MKNKLIQLFQKQCDDNCVKKKLNWYHTDLFCSHKKLMGVNFAFDKNKYVHKIYSRNVTGRIFTFSWGYPDLILTKVGLHIYRKWTDELEPETRWQRFILTNKKAGAIRANALKELLPELDNGYHDRTTIYDYVDSHDRWQDGNSHIQSSIFFICFGTIVVQLTKIEYDELEKIYKLSCEKYCEYQLEERLKN